MKRAAIFAALFFCAPAIAQDTKEVTVTSSGGGLALTGRVVAYDGTYLQIETQYGPLTLDYASVTCVGAACPDPDTFVPSVRFSGAASMSDVLLPALIDSFARSRGQSVQTTEESDTAFSLALQNDSGGDVALFHFRISNTDEGFADLIALEADMVLATREARNAEVTRAAEVGLGRLDDPAQSRILGIDALVPVTATTTGTREIAIRDLALAFQGRITNWQDIGGPDLPIALHLGPESNGQTQGYVDRVVRLGGRDLADTVVRHATIDDLGRAIAATPGALGVMPYRDTAFAQPLALRDVCGFVAVPVLTTLKTEDYPLTAPLFLYLPSRRLPQVIREFLAFLRTPQAQLVVRRAGFVDQGAIPISMDAQGQRFVNAIASAGDEVPLTELQRMVRVLAPRTRMSTSFRFEVGSTRLDAQSRSNLLSLGQAIRDGEFDGQNLMLVGFSDGRGAAEANRDLSSARAEAVKRALLSVMATFPDNVILETEAFGEALPMGCDDTEWGRQMNRRVELWVTQPSQ
ncbi:phosphate ABC transporter substrate-binding/OmpA family protein [Yoonia sp. 208BN28-4]|uniref:phosphate ABC transporter substrate-binding/OmpA family protein n=1 Tax=Yoonia sp. 208BN28-4 TaxID=3126505 RepID=UPI0030AD646C